MAGLSSKAMNGLVENRKKFQAQEFASKEFSDGSGLDTYEFKWRMHDSQIGRFWQIDPLTDKFVYNSTYAFSENKVTGHIELEGLETIDINMETRKGLPQNWSAEDKNRVMEAYTDGSMKSGVLGGKVAKIAAITVTMIFAPEIGIPLALSDITGVPVTPSPQAMAGSLTSSSAKTLSTIERSAANGTAFEEQVVASLAKNGHTNIAEQVTIKAENSIRTRVDAISNDKNGVLTLTEAKSSSTAPLTKNQKLAFPSIAQSGGLVVGKGKPQFPGGTVIPPTLVDIVRPVNDATYLRTPVYLPQISTSTKK